MSLHCSHLTFVCEFLSLDSSWEEHKVLCPLIKQYAAHLKGGGGQAPPELRTHELEILEIIRPKHELDNTPGVREMLQQVLKHRMAGNSRKQGIFLGGGVRRANLKWTGACFRIRRG